MTPHDQFCPNEACEARGEIGEGNIGCHSRKDRRYKCKQCGKTFTTTAGTPLYGLKTSHELFVIVVTLLAFGCPVQAIVMALGLDARTVRTWWAKAGGHCEDVHELRTGEPLAEPSRAERAELALRHAHITLETTNLPRHVAVRELRGQISKYGLDEPGSREIPNQLVRVDTLDDIEAILRPLMTGVGG